MPQDLNEHQRTVIANLLEKTTEGLSSEQADAVNTGMESLDQIRISSLLDSLHHTAPEAIQLRAGIMERLYYDMKLGQVLKEAKIDSESRREIINRIAGTEIAHKKGPERQT